MQSGHPYTYSGTLYGFHLPSLSLLLSAQYFEMSLLKLLQILYVFFLFILFTAKKKVLSNISIICIPHTLRKNILPIIFRYPSKLFFMSTFPLNGFTDFDIV